MAAALGRRPSPAVVAVLLLVRACPHLFAPTHAPPSTGASTVSPHTALLSYTLVPHPSSAHVASENAPCTPGCGVGAVSTAVGVGARELRGRRHRRGGEGGGGARLPVGCPVYACTSAQHRIHATVEVAASRHNVLFAPSCSSHPGNEGVGASGSSKHINNGQEGEAKHDILQQLCFLNRSINVCLAQLACYLQVS